MRAGERNRALTIVKSRGTRHSNQVRELILSEEGITLADVYTSEGEVLMGTMRWQKEQVDLAEEKRTDDEIRRKRLELEITSAELESRLQVLQREIKLKQTEMELLLSREESRKTLGATYLQSLLGKRDAEAAKLDGISQ